MYFKDSIPGFEILKILHESEPRIIYDARRVSDGRQVVLKTLNIQYPENENIAEIKHDYKLTRRLQFNGIIQIHSLISYGNGNLAIEMENFGASLSELIKNIDNKPWPLEQFFTVSLQLAKTLGQVHEHDIVHKDINPNNILVDPDSFEVRLIDFGISSELSRERQDTILSKRLEGTLPYISPEQTGRMNRDLDYRSDYYSLGITFFQLLTGQRPFSANDAIEWVHLHISRPPPTVISLNPNIPESLSKIVAKLISKNAEDRYQSSYGLVADLEHVRDCIMQKKMEDFFEPGKKDISRRFQIPQKIYGREKELEQLEILFNEVANGDGSLGISFISGYSGIGKSVIVNELGKSIVGKKGHLVSGKFDQFQQNTAYAAFAIALRSLIRQLLAQSKERLDKWCKSISEALGNNAQIIIDLVPDLELIIGKQPAVQDLPPTEAQNRFQILFINLLKVFIKDQPLVIFIDDLQWSDIPTLNLLNRIAGTQELNHLLIIGAYRDNEVDRTHPLTTTLNDIKKVKDVLELNLRPLKLEAVDKFVADTLVCSTEHSRPLSRLIFQKARGNPFFLIELLKKLYEENAISFNPGDGRWQWDLEAVKQADESDNVVEFMIASQRRLSKHTQQILQLAACIGNIFDLKTLSIIYEQSIENTSAGLLEVLKRNLIVPLSDNYKYVGLNKTEQVDNSDIQNDNKAKESNSLYKFQHDRVQQAAYSLIEPDKRQTVHLSIGRLIQKNSTTEELEERVIEVVSHFNEGRHLITEDSERLEVARLNLLAGVKAIGSSAYSSALGFLKIGHEVLPENAWDVEFELKWKLSWEMQQSAYLTGDYESADLWTNEMLERARTSTQKGEVLAVRTRQYATIGKMVESIQAACSGLKILGFDFLEEPSEDDVNEEVEAVPKNLGNRKVSELIDAPMITDPNALVASQLLMEIFPAAFLSGSGTLFPYLVLKSVNISLKFGSSPESAFSYAAYGMILCGAFNDLVLAYEYGKLAVALNEKLDDITLRSRIIYVYTMFIHHWSNHWSSMTPWFKKGLEAGYQSGDLLYLAYSAQDCIIWDPKLDLETASTEHRKYLKIVEDCEYQDSLDSGTLFLQMQMNFRGLTDGQFSMSDATFDEDKVVEEMHKRKFMTGIANYNIYKAEIHFIYNDMEGAYKYIKAQEEMINSVMSLPQSIRFRIISFLTYTALFPGMEKTEQETTLKRLKSEHEKMSQLSNICKENFYHLSLIMEAELSYLEKQVFQAISLYDKAIAEAKRNGFQHDEAMANELVFKIFSENGLSKASEGYLVAAHYTYSKWGAKRKAAQLKEVYPNILYQKREPQKKKKDSYFHNRTTTTSSHTLDIDTIMKASQSIAGEIVLENLLKKIMEIIIENAGARKGILVLKKKQRWFIEAEVSVDNPEMKILKSLPVENTNSNEESILPNAIVNYVIRTKENVVTDMEGRFTDDPYIFSNKPQSMMCSPIINKGELIGVIYLENNLSTGVFSEDRLQTINILTSQAAISIENAFFYDHIQKQSDAFARFVPAGFLKILGKESIEEVKLGDSVNKEMSVLFADIRSFTTISENMTPAENFNFINEYLKSISPAIAEHNGFIDKYIGDAIMALFPTTPDDALGAAIEMKTRLGKYNEIRKKNGDPEIRIGIGIHTGYLMLGTVGEEKRMDGTVISDAVNLASRLEGMTKMYGSTLVISNSSYEKLEDPMKYSFRILDKVKVKGKSSSVTLLEILDGDPEKDLQLKKKSLDDFKNGCSHFVSSNYVEAKIFFQKVLDINPKDKASQLYIERCDYYIEHGVPDDWDGVTTMTEK